MTNRPHGAPALRRPTSGDFRNALALGWQDFRANPVADLIFASFFVIAGLLMAWITYVTGHTFWLILAVMGFPLIGTLAAVGFYETSRRSAQGESTAFGEVFREVWSQRGGQLPWLSAIIIVTFLFWFFLGHMIFALFMGLSPMTNVSSSLAVFLSPEGLSMLGFGSVVGAAFALFVFAISVLGMPMLLDRDVDFITALLKSISAVAQSFAAYLIWGIFIAAVTLAAMIPAFLGLFIAMPILGHATWHLYKMVSGEQALTAD